MPHLQRCAKLIRKKALQTGVNVAQDVRNGDNIKTAVRKRTKQALGLPSQNLLQGKLGAGKKSYKKESASSQNQFTSRQENKNISVAKEAQREIFFPEVTMAFVHHESRNVENQG